MSDRGQYPRHKGRETSYDDEGGGMLESVRGFAHRDLEHIGLDRVMRLEKAYGKDDLRVKQAKLEAFFNAYAILGTVRYAAMVVGINHRAVSKLIKNNDKYKDRFEAAHDEFCEYLEQTAVVRAVTKSDSLLQFLLKANNPRKFSERLRVQALDEKDDKPLTLVFGEYSGEWDEPNYRDPDTITLEQTDPDAVITKTDEEGDEIE